MARVVFLIIFSLSSILVEASLKNYSVQELNKLALSQVEKYSIHWDKSQRDCAGFIRFIYKTTLFHSKDSFIDKNGKSVDYLSAKELVKYNFTFVSRTEFNLVKPGDIAVYYQNNERIDANTHLMLVVGDPLKRSKRKLLVYHNGSNRPQQSNMKKVWFDELQDVSAGNFRIDQKNKNFKGIYRWNGHAKN